MPDNRIVEQIVLDLLLPLNLKSYYTDTGMLNICFTNNDPILVYEPESGTTIVSSNFLNYNRHVYQCGSTKAAAKLAIYLVLNRKYVKQRMLHPEEG